MASSLIRLLLFTCAYLAASSAAERSTSRIAIVLPVTKDESTQQYLTHVHQGHPMVPVRVVIDLGGPFLWLDCASGSRSGSGYGVDSSSHSIVRRGSIQCSRAQSDGNSCLSSKMPNACTVNTVNPITGFSAVGELVEDAVAVEHVAEYQIPDTVTTVEHFLFSCAPSNLLGGLAGGVKGMLGLGRSKISLPSQLVTSFGFHRKFAVCLSPTDGVILSGDRPSISLFSPGAWKSLMYTPLVSNQQDYYINVKAIKVNGKQLSLKKSLLSLDQTGSGGTKLSTVVPYTTMESSIYNPFVKAYTEIMSSMNMTRVKSMAPFRVCYRTISDSRAEKMLPAIDLVLQSEMVKWRMDWRNSMVRVTDQVMCLGFLDGGLSPRGASIVIGGYQMEDNLLEFDLGTSMLGFSSSLLKRQTSCSDFKFYSMTSHELIRSV